MNNTRSFINIQIKKAFNIHYPTTKVDDKFFNVIYVGNHGIDYSMKSLIGLQKYLQTVGIAISCQELFDKLTSDLDSSKFDVFFDRNCININLKTNYVCELIKRTFIGNVIEQTQNKKKILVDFSSPNIAKDMHVGHLRSTIIGDSICKLFEAQGHDVHRINHIGDFGLQFGMIIQHLLEKYPDYQKCNFSIGELQTFYAESKKRFDNDEAFNKAAYNKVVLLQSGDPDIVAAWNFIKDISRISYNEIYARLNVNLTEVGESFYQQHIPVVVAELKAKGLIIEDDGRQIIKVDGYEVPLTVVKSDGGFTYDTTDLAAIKFRLVNCNYDKAIYVVDNGQALHFELIFEVARMAGWIKEHQEVKHVGFGVVLGPDGKKFKSRMGDTVKLSELLDESLVEAKEILDKKSTEKSEKSDNKVEFTASEKEEIIKNVAYGSIKYADLASTRTNDYKFSFDKMLSFNGNTCSFQLYEFVRLSSILRNAGVYGTQALEHINEFNISEKEEIHVCKVMLAFPEVIEKMSDDLMFHTLCSYLYELANAVSSFHVNCRCLNFNEHKVLTSINYNRLLICIAAKYILEQCFNILGINKLEKM